MGAIVTQAIVNEEGDTVIAAESGEILFWNLESKSVVYSDEARGVVQIKLNKKQTKLLIVQSSGPIGNHKGKSFLLRQELKKCQSLSVPLFVQFN